MIAATLTLTLAAIAVWFWLVFRRLVRERRAFHVRISKSFDELTQAGQAMALAFDQMGHAFQQLIPIMEAFGQAVRETELEPEGDE